MKCDETMPACIRCVKFQGYCGGYKASAPSSSRSQQQRQPSNVFPQSQSADIRPSPASTGAEVVRMWNAQHNGPTLVEPNFNSNVFASEWDKVYFDHWLTVAPNMGGGWFKSRLWTYTIPQLCMDDPAIRYAAMAIGAMANAMAPNIVPKVDNLLWGNQPHYNNAVTYYGRALPMIGRQRDRGPRAAVLACILFVCFEVLHNDRKMALKHINHGLHIIEQLVRAEALVGSGSSLSEVLTRSPVVEDEVIQVFQRLDLQSWSLGLFKFNRATDAFKSRPAERYPFRPIPASFADLAEARQWWNLAQYWMFELPRAMVPELDRMKTAAATPKKAIEMDIYRIPGARELQRASAECLKAWNAAFCPLYHAALQNKKADEETYLMAISLQLQYLTQSINVQSACHSDYRAIYMITPQFREINRLAGILLPRQPKLGGCSESFTMDNGPGFWDSRAIMALAVHNRLVEAENETEGTLYEQYVPPSVTIFLFRLTRNFSRWMRLRQREVIFDEREPKADIFSYRKDLITGVFTYRRETVWWGGTEEARP